MRKLDNQLEDFFGLQASNPGVRERESIKDAIIRKLSWHTRIRLLPKLLSSNERYAILGLLALLAVSIAAIPVTTYLHYTTEVPATGGSFTEGILGEPRLVNPLLAQSNDADRDLTSLIYSGLMRYSGNGKLVPDLAKSSPDITSDGLTYSVQIKDDAYWHDGVPVTADDVVFTVRTAQNPDYGSPSPVQAVWGGVSVEKVSERVVAFHLKNKYAQFLNNLTIGILPKHLWQNVKPINFSLSELNIKPIGSGPYKFTSLVKNDLGRIDSYKLTAFERSHVGRPYINQIVFRFYGSEDELISAFNTNKIDNIGYISGANVNKLRFPSRVALERIKMPRYFALFLNQNQSRALSDKNVRLALNMATDRVQIINENLGGNAFIINSPMIGGILDINTDVTSYDYNLAMAKNVLTSGGWAPGPGGVLAHGKDNPLDLTITTSTWPELASVADMIKQQWERLGAKVTVQALPISKLQQIIKDRDYQILLFGEILTIDPDPYSLWHSSQRQAPGLNLALYSNKTADKLLEDARQTLNPLERRQKYDDFQKILIGDIPAVFLYSPHYLYGVSNNIRGVDTKLIAVPSNRFDNIRNWYLNTSRKFK